jgi:fructose-1,6-bisphosphatase/inositol monophosphatase family enzyme
VDDASLAAELARAAGTLAAEMLADGLETKYKSSRSDVVSAADHAAEKLVAARLRELRPDDGVVGEEGARREGGGRTWYLDPVDGTYNFLSGIPYWCSAIGLADGEVPVLGAVFYPVLDQLWLGGPDLPTSLNGTPVRRLVDQPLSAVSLTTHFHPRHLADHDRLAAWQAVTARVATVRMLGSASVDLAGVASGRLGVFLQANLQPWDWVPGAALVTGAGGVATTLEVRGNRWHVAGNQQAVDDTLAALRAG